MFLHILCSAQAFLTSPVAEEKREKLFEKRNPNSSTERKTCPNSRSYVRDLGDITRSYIFMLPFSVPPPTCRCRWSPSTCLPLFLRLFSQIHRVRPESLFSRVGFQRGFLVAPARGGLGITFLKIQSHFSLALFLRIMTGHSIGSIEAICP